MKRYFSVISKSTSEETEEDKSNVDVEEPEANPNIDTIMQSTETPQHESPSLPEVWKVNGISLQSDPALRQRISLFHPDVQDEIRRAYLIKGTFQPKGICIK
ncbi:hypothetical protein LINGRAHAP2_LOCUS19994 [Linum grandiflorum]